MIFLMIIKNKYFYIGLMLNGAACVKKCLLSTGRRPRVTLSYSTFGSKPHKLDNNLPHLNPQKVDQELIDKISQFDNWARNYNYAMAVDFQTKMEKLIEIDFFSQILKSNENHLSHHNSAIEDGEFFNFCLKLSQNPNFSQMSFRITVSVVKFLIASRRSMSYQKLRIICLILYFPSIYSNIENLNSVIQIVGTFSKTVHQVFATWLANLPHLLSRIVNGCHSLLNAFYEKFPLATAIGASQSYIFETLDICYSANELCQYQLPLSAFFNKNVDQRATGKIFLTFPFVLGFQTRLKICRTQTREQQISSEVEHMLRGRDGRLDVFIRRSSYFDDFKRQFMKARPSYFYRRLKIVFAEEVAIDAGGPQKEFIRMITANLRDSSLKLVNKRLFWFKKNPIYKIDNRLLGIVVGLAISNEIIIPIRFPRILYSKLLKTKRKSSLKDLMELDPVLAENLSKILEMKNRGEDISKLDLSFEITNDEGENVILCSSNSDQMTNQNITSTSQYNLGGSESNNNNSNNNISILSSSSPALVTNENVLQYINEYVDYEINRRYNDEFESFRSGFELSCPSAYLNMLAAEELDLVVSGAEEFDWGALVTVAKYKDGLETTSDEVRWFWEVFWELSQDEKMKFLKFTTGADRAPFGGLGKIRIKFRKGGKHDKLPVAHTCFNMFFLPRYRSKMELKSKLLLALEYSEGFGIE